MTRIDVAPHLTADEIDRRYRSCPDAAEKTRWQVLWRITRPGHRRSVADAARVVGLTPRWARTLVRRYNGGGPDALADGRRGNGAAPKLTPDRQAERLAAVQSRPPDGGLWSGPKVIALVRDRWAVAVGHSTGWQWLKDLGFRLAVPRPRHPKAASADEPRRRL